ncbi:MAG: hypothetical protein KKG04_09745 [Candidatus Thermoplasmatota archaeon]|nr:hypothetical protein [Candidatus Thermoplasmatota archaeon]
MRQVTTITILAVVFSIICMTLGTTAATQVTMKRQEITIDRSDQGLAVEEKIIYSTTSIVNQTLLLFSVPSGASQIELIVASTGETFLIYPVDETIYEFNLSQHKLLLAQDTTVQLRLTYNLPTNTELFQKTILYDTKYISVTFNDRTIFQVENIGFDDATKNSFSLALYRPTEAPLSLTALIIIFALVVILIFVMLLLVRKKRVPNMSTESETTELLNTKKTLFLTVLKDIEKQHRNKQISDETYSKLKAEYKSQAVVIMRKLEN